MNILNLNKDEDYSYDDIFCGSEYLDLHQRAHLTEDDVVVSLSLDGCQLYQNKASDTWISIWIIDDLHPSSRYKKRSVLPGCFIPGPRKPKKMDTFLFRGIHHLSALQKENNGHGMCVWDASKEKVIYSRVAFLMGMADALGMPEIDRQVGHHGAKACWMCCQTKGRHKPGSGHYHLPHNHPSDAIPGCDHPDVDIRNLQTGNVEDYLRDLATISTSTTQAQYHHNRKETGLSKPTIFSGLDTTLMPPVPRFWVLDLMHLLKLNIPELLLSLWRGTISCERTDSKLNWPWMKLTGDTWTEHGKAIADCTQNFPTSFSRPPRNPAEKLNSGYKATEFYWYIFGLGPAHFRVILPQEYWHNFCHLTHGVHIILQRTISDEELQDAHTSFVQTVEEFEDIYYQCHVDRIHFCPPCIHTLLHLAPEVACVGPGCYSTQFTIERTIGNLGKKVKQPSNPFANLSQRGLCRAQTNALQSMCPEFNKSIQKKIPQGAHDLGNGFTLHPKKDRYKADIDGIEGEVISRTIGHARIQRWAELQLPNGQWICSIWKEKAYTKHRVHIARNIKININENIEYGEVQFYFLEQSPMGEQAYALVPLYSPPDPVLLEESFQTIWACSYQGLENLQVIKVQDIICLVSMQELPFFPGEAEDLWFVVEKPGMDDW
ncbi:hypothetical protein BDQ17DRAFT_1438524 [Cyathus striatus]|nr:hypothetical protein BDQ17DRAFT_1438524 [Cyathus striatus]